MLSLEKMSFRQITGANYITSVNGMIHPDRIMQEHDFLYMLDGTWEIFEEDIPYVMCSDDLLILRAGRHHYGKEFCNPGNRHMYLHVAPTPAELIQEEADTSAETPSEKSMEKGETVISCPTLLHCQDYPQIRQYFHDIISCYWSKARERENRLSLLFNLLLCDLGDLETSGTINAVPDAMVEEIIHRIRTTPQVFFTSSAMAADYFICERTLNNRFHAACQKTFHACQMEIHLEMAKQFLLSQPGAKLHEVALNFGFYDEFHLSKAFKKQFGCSPRHYSSAL